MPASVPDPEPAITVGDLHQFRRQVYDCFTGWKDTLFELIDALLVGPQRLESLPWLSMEAPMRRGHGSIYRALNHGRVDPAGLARVLTGLLPRFTGTGTDSGVGAERARPAVFALDSSHWPRPGAATSPERTYTYDAGKDHRRAQQAPVTPGWWFQWIAATTPDHSSWALPLDLTRIAPSDNHHIVAVTQIQALLARLNDTGPARPAPIVCLDGDYSITWIARQLTGAPVQLIGRLRTDASVFTDPPPRLPTTRGRPRVHGPKMKLADPMTWPEPDQVALVPARPDRGRHHGLSVLAWHGLHADRSKTLPEPHPGPGNTREVARGSVIRIHSATPGMPAMWLWWSGPPGTFDLDTVWRAYLHRFDIEHLFRFCKQYLGWTLPRLRDPDAATRWSWLVAAAYAHLVLARDLVGDDRLPWEQSRPLSPLRVKRGFRALHARLGTPTKVRKTSRPGPGRPPGARSTPAPRHPVIRKRPKSSKPKTRKKTRASTPPTPD